MRAALEIAVRTDAMTCAATLLMIGVMGLSGCAGMKGMRASSPPKSDPLASLYRSEPAAAAFPGLRVAVVSSVNMRATSAALRQGSAWTTGGGGNYQDIFKAIVAVLQRHFKEATVVRDIDEAERLGPDLIVVLDSEGSFSAWNDHLDVRLDGIFVDGKTPLETVRAETSQHQFMYGFNRVSRKFALAAEDLSRRFESALLAAPNLRGYAAARSTGKSFTVAAAAPAAAPAPKSSIDTPSYKSAENADNIAVVIGIERYENAPAASWAERDAAAMREHLRAMGYPERNIVFLAGSKAGKASVEKYVESWLPRRADEKSKVLFYFSGHGAPEPTTGQAYLLPFDGDPRYLDTTGYPIKKLYAKLSALKAKQVVVVLDSCFSGAGGRSVLAQGLRPLVTKVDAESASFPKLVILAASAAEEVTGAAESQGHGLFTYHLLRAIDERKGAASVKELFDALKPRVQDAARLDNRDQTPQLLPASRADLGAVTLR